MECKLLHHIIASSAETETAGLIFNAQSAIPSAKLWLFWDILNRQLHSNLTTQQQLTLQRNHSAKSVRSLGTWDSIGFVIFKLNSNSVFFGKKVVTIKLITSLSITLLNINNKWVNGIFIQSIFSTMFNLLSWEGVLILLPTSAWTRFSHIIACQKSKLCKSMTTRFGSNHRWFFTSFVAY